MKKIIYLLLFLSCSSCAVLDKLDFPDNVHEEIENQGKTRMSKSDKFGK